MQLYMNITTGDYSSEDMSRRNFKNYTLYDHYRYFEFDILIRQQNVFFCDHWADRLLKEGILAVKKHRCYYQTVMDFLRKQERSGFWDQSNEAIYISLHQIRTGFLPKQETVYFKDHMDFGPACSLTGGIDQTREKSRLIEEKEQVLVMISDWKLLDQGLRDLDYFVKCGKKVYLLLKTESLTPAVSADKLIRLLEEQPEIGAMIRMVRENGPGRLTDFRCIEYDPQLQNAVDRGDIFLCGYGEEALLSVRNLKLDSIIHVIPEMLYTKAAVNLYSDHTYSVIYAPGGFDLFPYLHFVELPELTYSHTSSLSEQYGNGIYSDPVCRLYEKFPDYFINVFGELPCESAIASGSRYLKEYRKDLAAWLIYKADLIQEKIVRSTDIHNFSVYHTHTDGSGHTLINGLLIKGAERAQVFLVDSYSGMSFRQYMRKMGVFKESRYICNFMFFTTPYIFDCYNRLRSQRPEEQIQPACAHIDYYFIREPSGIRQSFPLYNKSCIGMDDNGQFYIFHYQLGGGRIWINGYGIVWNPADVNAAHPQRVSVYTPYMSIEDERQESWSYTKVVGQGRVNVVIFGEKIVCIRRGDVMLPSIGVVISLTEEEGDRMLDCIGVTKSENGYCNDCCGLSLKVDLDPPKTVGKDAWNNMRWVFGGGISLIDKGISLFDWPGASDAGFRQEGWLSPLSVQTQESKTHDEVERHPRTVLGLTKAGELFVLVFSGRSRISRGVTYREVCGLARRYIGEIESMINLDGGASSFLGVCGNGVFAELSYPACTDSTCTGQVRNVNSLLII